MEFASIHMNMFRSTILLMVDLLQRKNQYRKQTPYRAEIREESKNTKNFPLRIILFPIFKGIDPDTKLA